MTEILRPDLCVIGGGPGGLAAAQSAAKSGANVVLVERRTLGGMAHLAAAWQTQTLATLASRVASLRAATKFGLGDSEVRIDFKRMRRESDAACARFMREESPGRLAALNIRIVPEAGAFTSPSRFEAGSFVIEARHFLLAISSMPAPCTIPGFELVRPLTADRIAELLNLPKRLLVIGANHESLVLAQAFSRFGSKVALLQQAAFLEGEDPELTAPLRTALHHDGMDIVEHAEINHIEVTGSGPQSAGLKILLGSGETIEGSHLIYAGERAPLVEGLGLKAAHVAYDKDGPKCDAERRSSNKKIYAINDGHDSFESIASARREAEFVAALLTGERPPPLRMARVIGTDPEIAVIGLSEEEARAQSTKIRVFRAPFSDNLRAQTLTLRTPYSATPQAVLGHVKIIADPQGHLLGAGIVGPQARELIGIFSLGLAKGLKVEDLTALAAGEPTLLEICRAAALASAPQTGKVERRRLFSAWRSPR